MIYDKLIVNIIDAKIVILKYCVPSRTQKVEHCHCFCCTWHYKYLTEQLDKSETEAGQIAKKKLKLLLYASDRILHVESLEDSRRKLVRTVKFIQ